MNKFRSAILGGQSADPAKLIVGEKKDHAADAHHLTSVDVPRETTRLTNHRDGDRHRLSRETAAIMFKGKSSEVELINLSDGGAMIRADIKPKLWDRIDLSLGEGGALECAVRWLRDDRIGLEFAHETQIDCNPEQRDALLLEVIRRSFPDIVLAKPEPAPAAPAEEEAPAAPSSRRSSPRHPLIWTGEVLWQHDSQKVRIRNISASGALIDNPGDLPEGADVILMLGEAGQLFATVGWSRGGQAGLAFAAPFDVSALAASRPQVAAQNWERPHYLAPKTPAALNSSPWAKQWGRRSMEELRDDLEGYMKY